MPESSLLFLRENSSKSFVLNHKHCLMVYGFRSAQRNMYLTGFCLFLSLVLTRTLHLLFELINTQAEHSKLKKQVESTKTGGKAQDSSKEIADLKKKVAELEAKDRDFETLKKQSQQQAAEYDRLATKYNAITGSSSDKRKD
ncbi:hypothetical protein M378DRAFT_526750 [Amanita muscaria Koide BX008]|uniref:Endoplasmic reticulum transmembrane protein n=1 Tax=Amanita muscaria (strain Koide BX008) TaxID=946122 RepID=A0A0C2TEV5_AMAMK|nr:hypothetical protein M378DRAFT_526750 [Amanita muscaria Koide BX008]